MVPNSMNGVVGWKCGDCRKKWQDLFATFYCLLDLSLGRKHLSLRSAPLYNSQVACLPRDCTSCSVPDLSHRSRKRTSTTIKGLVLEGSNIGQVQVDGGRAAVPNTRLPTLMRTKDPLTANSQGYVYYEVLIEGLEFE